MKNSISKFLTLHLILGITLMISCSTDSNKAETKDQKFSPPEPAFIAEGNLIFIRDLDTLSQIDIEIADNEARRQRGLMYRTKMKENNGMLFIFDNAEPQSFWMENTYISLDILFIGTNLEILQISANTVPYTRSSVTCKKPAQYVLELNAGICKELGINVGDRIVFKRN